VTDEPHPLEPPPGQLILRLSLLGTGVFVAAAVAAAISPDPLGGVAAAIDLALFAIGCVAFLWAFGVAVARSRTEEISVAGIYFLSGGSGPPSVRRVLLGAVGVQVVVAVATAAARPFTNLAFGVLVPVFGLGMAGLWTARHGTFPARRDEARPAARTASGGSGTGVGPGPSAGPTAPGAPDASQ
jgi:hypothetical protein